MNKDSNKIPTYGTTSINEKLPKFELSPKHLNRRYQWYFNMFLINFVEFSAESSRGIILATLYLYNKSLGGDLAFMGLLTAVFSVGRFLSSMIFGWMSDRFTFRTVYILSSAICLVGNFLYLLADQHVVASKELLAFSRFVVGFGAGNRSVCRANVAAVTTIHQRLKYITILATVVFLGYAITPGLGNLVADVDMWFLGIHINKFTAPGVILIILNLITIISMVIVFDESVGREDAPLDSFVESKETSSDIQVSDRIVKIGVATFMLLNFIARGILSVFETVNIPLFLKATDSDPSSTLAVKQASNFQFWLGCAGLLTYLSIEVFRHRISDITWLIIGFFTLAMGNFILSIAPSNLTLGQLISGEIFVWSIGCPITTAVVVATFSKILGGRPQGTLMGLLGSSASVSRMVLPMLPALLSSFTPLFILNVFMCISSCIAIYWYNNLVQKSKCEPDLETEQLLRSTIGSPPRSPIHTQTTDETDF